VTELPVWIHGYALTLPQDAMAADRSTTHGNHLRGRHRLALIVCDGAGDSNLRHKRKTQIFGRSIGTGFCWQVPVPSGQKSCLEGGDADRYAGNVRELPATSVIGGRL
jgi:hypothetical protein